MNEQGNKYAVAALRERRAGIAGEIASLERRIAHLRETLVHVDATLLLFDPDADPSRMPVKRPYRRVKLFGPGKLNRLVLDALRAGGRPMTSQEVIGAIVAKLDYEGDASKAMSHRVRANLAYLARTKGYVLKEGERQSARWRLAERSS